METNEISMFMDAKLDIHDKKPEAIKLRTWIKCLVKIEAIKCFPCYLRITFIRNVEDESANLCVRINIPGITIRLASSRTKSFSYGIFWKNNRKRCSIFLAFDTQISCERHMKWFKKSLKNLELHRQEILETRRTSRSNSSIIDLAKTLNMSSFIENKKNLQDILGPLPKIPDFQENNWSRRVSGMSEIYEEIPDRRRESRRFSRVSGIYEEMRAPHLNFDLMKKDKFELPPPLPPRKRANTNQTDENHQIPRCNTNPEIEINRKKGYLHLLENVFAGRSKRSESVSEGKVSVHEELIDLVNTPDKAASTVQLYSNELTPRAKRKFPYLFVKNKRNSFSSPDLSKINQFDEFEDLNDLDSISSELEICNLHDGSAEDVYSSHGSNLNAASLKKNNNCEESSILNISDQITSNFNFSCNSSTINLVGSNLNSMQTPGKIVFEDISGYCAMAPIIRTDCTKKAAVIITVTPPEENQFKTTTNDSDKENEYSFKPPLCIKNVIKKISMVNYEQNTYENITKICSYEQDNKCDVIYQNLIEPQKPDLIASTETSDDDKNEHSQNSQKEEHEDYYKTPRKTIISIDEKVPSYYPNSCDTKKCQRQRTNSNASDRQNSSIRHLTSAKLTHSENLYISSPQKILDQRLKLMKNTTSVNKNVETNDKMASLKACKISENVYSVKRFNENDTNNSDDIKDDEQSNPSIEAISFNGLQNIDFTFEDSLIKNIDSNVKLNGRLDIKKKIKTQQSATPKIFQKYSTMARITSPNTYTEKPTFTNSLIKLKSTPTSNPDLSTIKKFTSLPRFKKIDFSPLKIKINNVLQRHQSDGL